MGCGIAQPLSASTPALRRYQIWLPTSRDGARNNRDSYRTIRRRGSHTDQ